MNGPIGFNELTRRSPVNPTTLAQRLDLLEEAGIVTRTVHSAIPPKTSYALTEKGLALRGVPRGPPDLDRCLCILKMRIAWLRKSPNTP